MLQRMCRRDLIKFAVNFMGGVVKVIPALVGEHDCVLASIIQEQHCLITPPSPDFIKIEYNLQPMTTLFPDQIGLLLTDWITRMFFIHIWG